jgi:glycosyltransferase involved in cell wall biosynthesis
MPLSVVLITKNASARLKECLASVAFADEILLVDSGSVDATLDIARQHGARILQKEWLGFGPQKQFAVDSATHDWVLCLDADEWLSDALREDVIKTLKAPAAMAFEMPRCNRFIGRWLRHGEGYPDYCLRLFNRRHARWSDDAVHEKVIPSTPVARLKGDLMHDSAESLESYLDKQHRYTSLQAAQMLAAGKSAGLARLVLSPLVRFIKFYFIRLGMLDGFPGFLHVCIGCMNSFNKYAKLIAARHSTEGNP